MQAKLMSLSVEEQSAIIAIVSEYCGREMNIGPLSPVDTELTARENATAIIDRFTY